MKFEDLCKRNKIFFIMFILLGSYELFFGIIMYNYHMIIYSLWIFLEAFHVINSQLSDNIIKDYENMMGLSITNNHEIEKMVCKAIKNNDTKLLNKFVELVEERDKKDGC